MVRRLFLSIFLFTTVSLLASDSSIKTPVVTIDYIPRTSTIIASIRTPLPGDRESAVVVCKDLKTGEFVSGETIEHHLTDKQTKMVPNSILVKNLEFKINDYEMRNFY